MDIFAVYIDNILRTCPYTLAWYVSIIFRVQRTLSHLKTRVKRCWHQNQMWTEADAPSRKCITRSCWICLFDSLFLFCQRTFATAAALLLSFVDKNVILTFHTAIDSNLVLSSDNFYLLFINKKLYITEKSAQNWQYSLTCLNRNLTNPDTCLNRLCWKVPANSLHISMYLFLANPDPV